MARLGPLALLFGFLSSCGGAAHAPTAAHVTALPPRPGPPRHVALQHDETLTFPAGMLRPGDVVTCVVSDQRLRLRVPDRPTGTWAVGKAIATPTGHGGALQLRSTREGSVTATCGHKKP